MNEISMYKRSLYLGSEHSPLIPSSSVPQDGLALLRGTTVIRTHDVLKKLYIAILSLIIFGLDYYGPGVSDLIHSVVLSIYLLKTDV